MKHVSNAIAGVTLAFGLFAGCGGEVTHTPDPTPRVAAGETPSTDPNAPTTIPDARKQRILDAYQKYKDLWLETEPRLFPLDIVFVEGTKDFTCRVGRVVTAQDTSMLYCPGEDPDPGIIIVPAGGARAEDWFIDYQVAHELGHAVLDVHGAPPVNASEDQARAQEVEQAASCLAGLVMMTSTTPEERARIAEALRAGGSNPIHGNLAAHADQYEAGARDGYCTITP